MGQITGRQAGAGGAASIPAAIGDFFICDMPWASPKDDMASMEHPLFTLATRPDRRILRYAHGEATIEVTPSVKGLATIHDKDVLIYCVSQLMAALNEGRPTSRELHLKAHDLLLATSREASGDGYRRLREALERLSGTRIVTNIATGGVESTRGFGLIDAWEILRKTRNGRIINGITTTVRAAEIIVSRRGSNPRTAIPVAAIKMNVKAHEKREFSSRRLLALQDQPNT